MTIFRLVFKEICYRKLSFILTLLSVIAAVGCVVAATALLRLHDTQTQAIVSVMEAEIEVEAAKLKDDIRKAALKLGFNILILPRDLELDRVYLNDFSKYMPESYVDKLSRARIVTVRHLFPSLCQKIVWPETKRTVILIGTRGEVPFLHKTPKKALVEAVPPKTVVLGHELHHSMGLTVGDKVKLLGREFTVHKCRGQQGTQDDITVWINLKEAQELLKKQGLINMVLALECFCVGANLAQVRQEIEAVLPDTRVVEKASKTLARAEARQAAEKKAKADIERVKHNRAKLKHSRQRLATILSSLIIISAVLWVGISALLNVRERGQEIGIQRALGLRSRQILFLFLSREVVIGALGAVLGYVCGWLAGAAWGQRLVEGVSMPSPVWFLFDPALLGWVVVLAPLAAGLAGWIPSLIAVQQDPAELLREE